MTANFPRCKALRKRLGALTVLTVLAAGSAAAPAAAHAPSVDLVVLGDSYSAGIGAGDIGQSAVVTNAACYVTSAGYAEALGERRRAVELTANAACSGARASDGAGAADGVVDLPEQIAIAKNAEILGSGTDLVAVTAGGNDVQFGNIIGACATPPLSNCEAAVAQAVSVANTQVAPALAENYRRIHEAAPDATIAAVGYPHLFSSKRGQATLLSPEAVDVFNKGVDTLNGIIEETAEKSESAVYVDVTNRFRNHGIGSSDPWINFNPDNLQDHNNFHPNAEGYAKGYAKALNRVVGSSQR